MSTMSLRWGGIAGLLGAALGTLALVIGGVLEPVQPVSNPLTVAVALFVRGLLVLLVLGVTLLIVYYAGYRIEQALSLPFTGWQAPAANADDATAQSAPPQMSGRMQAALAGVLAMFCYWIVTTLYIVTIGQRIGGVGVQSGTALSFTISHVIQGAVLVGLGAGFASLGGRAGAARRLMRNLTLTAERATLAPPLSPTATASPTPATPAPAPSLASDAPPLANSDAPSDATDATPAV